MPCQDGHYCPGGDFITDDGDKGHELCPTPVKNSNYTPAQRWISGETFEDVAPDMHSDNGRKAKSDCYATVQYAGASFGKGQQKCYYNNNTYDSNNCDADSIRILTCVGGHYRENVNTSRDCAIVGDGWYSVTHNPERTRCPEYEIYGSDITTNGVTDASTPEACVHDNAWGTLLDSNNEILGGYTKRCFWSTVYNEYRRQCGKSYKMRKCASGYADPNNGTETFAEDAACVKVGNGHWSPGPSNWNPVIDADASIVDNECKPVTYYAGTVADDIDTTKNNPDTGTQTASAESQCYLNCKAEKTENGSILDVTNPLVHFNTSSQTYAICEYSSSICPENYYCDDNGQHSCSEATNGQYPYSDAGKSSVAYCYRNCVKPAHASAASGHDYYGTNVPDTCDITCESGYTLQNGACVLCPSGSVCNPDIGTKTCSELTNGQYPYSDTGTSNVAYCYRECANGQNSTAMSGRDYYSAADTCAITQCAAGYTLQNGACVKCPSGSVCNPDIGTKTCSELTNGQYTLSDAGTSDVAYCYKNCANAQNATAMSGRDYYTAADTCAITQCADEYALQNGACVLCPTDSYCDGHDEFQCPSGYTSDAGASKKTDCYQDCQEYNIGNCLMTPVVAGKIYWSNVCQHIASIDGNPAQLVNGQCVLTGCKTGYEMINGDCEPCGRENAISYRTDGTCLVESCTIGFHPLADGCEPDVIECSAPNATYAEQRWVATRAAYGICTIKTCDTDYHLASNACVADEQVCNIENGTGSKVWNAATKSWGPCIATECEPGYTNDPYEKNKASEQCSECRNKFSTLGEVAASSYITGCEIASCMYQGEKYNLENNECVPICDQPYSDETGSLRWNNSTKKCDRTCNPGYMPW